MKQCPRCKSAALYEDSAAVCPDCGTQLVFYRPEPAEELRWDDLFSGAWDEPADFWQTSQTSQTSRTGRQNGQTAGTSQKTGRQPSSGQTARRTGAAQAGASASFRQRADAAGQSQRKTGAAQEEERSARQRRRDARSAGQGGTAERPFERQEGRYVVLRGRVTEVTPGVTRYQSRLHKLFNSLFRGEPYQFAHGTYRCVFWMEEESERFSERSRQLVYYGDIEGLVAPGYRMTVRARPRGGELVARSLYNDDLEQDVRGRAQMPAWLVWILTLAVLALAGNLIVGAVQFLSASRSVLGMLLLGYLAWRLFFRRRRRRY